ncbi:MAG: hypothetical protein K6F77_08880 [Lachnospiraceae bacterium]|nr:hypothetical protein [Lachnospiraceae bacterium]
MDVKETVDQLFDKVKGDKDLQKKFMSNPKGAIEELAGVKIPDEQVDDVIEMIQKKIKNDTVSDVLDKVKDLF